MYDYFYRTPLATFQKLQSLLHIQKPTHNFAIVLAIADLYQWSSYNHLYFQAYNV